MKKKTKTAEVVNLLFMVGLAGILLINLYQLKQRDVQFYSMLKVEEAVKRMETQIMENKKRAYKEFKIYHDLLTNHNIRKERISGMSVKLFLRYNEVCAYVPSNEIGTKYNISDAFNFVDLLPEERKTYLQKIFEQTKLCFEYKE